MPPALETAAQNFRQLFTDNGSEYHLLGGQFALVRAMRAALKTKIYDINDIALREALLALTEDDGWSDLVDALRSTGSIHNHKPYRDGLPAGHPDKAKPYGVLRSGSRVNGTAAYTSATASARDKMNAAQVSLADKAVATAVLSDNTASGEWAYGRVNQWLGQPKLAPATFDKVSLPRQCALFLDSTVMCGSASQFTAKQLFRTRNVDTQSLPAFSPVTLTSLNAKDSRSTDTNLILNYTPNTLQSTVAKATALLSAGGYLVAGCLSGRKHEDDHPPIEHYILLFAVADNMFLFWDPDVSVTNIAELTSKIGPAVGVMIYDNADSTRPKLSTGLNFSDLSDIDINGHHTNHRKRHRYQVMTLAKP
ncbi:MULTISPECIES: hypothetical protein [unclassified Chelatococcus]|uniref:hypothetical protein n=1 Tax=unclassified Chelatococcus TaxID=2638111 RepID=UPI001BCB0499|nr:MULTISPECIES: hypothetical protein [unclassified Chelatococcus]MBS7699819.1 hypothetical protein [Chelatococcus sp. YT9]MBX3558165.1 hypothetical protein [Chelatococcus sp.]